MKLKAKNKDFSKPEDRHWIIKILKEKNDPNHFFYDFEPYMPNEGDWTYWKFDIGNNWGVKFFPESVDEFEINYRYNQEHEKFLADSLVALKIDLEIIQ